jgi:hypothetical protein
MFVSSGLNFPDELLILLVRKHVRRLRIPVAAVAPDELPV